MTKFGWNKLKQLFTIAIEENRISMRSGWSIGLTVLFGILTFLLVFFGGSNIGPTRFDAFLVSLLSLATYLIPLGSLVYGYDLVAGEEAILEPIFALPVSREIIILGKYLGRSFSLSGAIIIGFGLAGIGLITKSGFNLIIYSEFIITSILIGLAFLSISCLISIVSPNKPYSLGGCLVAWLWFILIHDLASISIVSSFDLPDIIFSLLILLNPADIYRVIVLGSINTSGGGLSTIFTNIGIPNTILMGFLVLWCIIPIVLGSKIIYNRNI